MIKSLLASCMLASSVGGNLLPQRNNVVTTEINGDYEVTYKYESKTPQTLDTQVESFSNFIFKFNKTWYDYNNSIQTVAFDLTFYILRGYITFDTSYSSVDESVLDDNTLYPSKDIKYSFNFDDNLNYININTSLVYSSITGATITYFSEDLVIQIDEFIYYYPQDLPVNYFFEYTDYNEIESIVPVTRHSNLYTLIYDFYYYIFENGTLSGITTSYNMPFDSWLCHSLTIITLLTGIFIIFLFLRWIFKVVSGLILLKH